MLLTRNAFSVSTHVSLHHPLPPSYHLLTPVCSGSSLSLLPSSVKPKSITTEGRCDLKEANPCRALLEKRWMSTSYSEEKKEKTKKKKKKKKRGGKRAKGTKGKQKEAERRRPEWNDRAITNRVPFAFFFFLLTPRYVSVLKNLWVGLMSAGCRL